MPPAPRGPGVLLPAGVHLPGRPLLHLEGNVEVVETPRAQPVHRAQEDVEGVGGEKARHLVHPPGVIVDLESRSRWAARLLSPPAHNGRSRPDPPWRGSPSTPPSRPAAPAGSRHRPRSRPGGSPPGGSGTGARSPQVPARRPPAPSRSTGRAGRGGAASPAGRAATGGGGSRAPQDQAAGLSRRDGSASRRLGWWSARRPPGDRRPACR